MMTIKSSKDTTKLNSRRSFLKAAASIGLSVPFLMKNAQAQQTGDQSKILVTYYSRTGNTRAVAEQVRKLTGADIFELKTTHSYPAEYRATTDQAKREQQENFRPTLTGTVSNMADYDVIFVGYPNWWATMPMAFFTFLESYDFAGKTIVPFCTHEGSRLGRSVEDLETLCPDATILSGLALRGASDGRIVTTSADAQNAVSDWIAELGISG
ncbi:flavodoxin [uncultured Cohaesibacter sp.]|uniref:flavodoxin n=1 Tax=uncultured Cohaesibacter sp. TaxID=1002546 RepID=UPI00292E28E0|nr:flavodoxin [uncultured Cohaesibacter sp.]